MTKITRIAILIVLGAALAAPAARCDEQAATQTAAISAEDSAAAALKYKQKSQEAIEGGDPDKAMSIITEGLYKVQGRDRADMFAARALIHYRLGRKDDAFKDISAAIATAPDAPSPYETRGMIDFDTSDFPMATADLDRAIQLGSLDPATCILRGNLYMMRNDPRSALRMYDKALEASPDYYEAVFQRGYAYSRMGLIKKAAEQYAEFIKKTPDNAFAHNNMGIMDGQLGLVDESAKEFKTAAEQNPHFSSAWSNLGYTLYEKGDVNGALDAYAKAEEAEKNNVYPICNHAEAYINQGNAAKARGMIRKCLKTADSDAEFKSDEAYYLRAMEYLKSLIDNDQPIPTYAEAVAAAKSALDANDRLTAYINYSIAYMLKPDTEEVLYGLGLCTYRLGRYARAVSFLTPYLGLYPDGPHAADAVAMLKKIAPEFEK